MKTYNTAVVGATGAVGQEMIKILEERNFPIKEIKLLASARSARKRLKFKGKDVIVEELTPDSFKNVDIALFSIGAEISKKFAPIAVKSKTVVVDNSSAWRMDPGVPLVVPEVNPLALEKHKGIVANPNCSTIQMVVVLKPLHDAARIKRIVVSSYQSVSGWGREAMEQLYQEMQEILSKVDPRSSILDPSKFKPASSIQLPASSIQDPVSRVLPYQIAFNVIPQIDDFIESGYTKEEMKMVNETRKIMEDDSIQITATCVRVPVYIGHSEAINIETETKLTAKEVREILSKAPGVVVIDDPKESKYPIPIDAAGKDETFVGRIREDESIENGLNLWVVSDNLRKGAALNTIQIAELLIEKGLISTV
ncbi:aspartate-semialdehyde dehydrogenase [bacterium]|nr:aspartate-semialdehyde dehydrogenase [bacterium]